MILARELAQAMNSYPPWPVNETYENSHNQWWSYEPYDNTYNPKLRNYQDFSWSHDEGNTYEQSQEDAATIPSYGEIVERYEFSDDFSSVANEDEKTEDEEMETEENVKEVKDVPFDAPLLYKELKPYVPPITF
ncbi:hypothetical protein QYF36_015979 [Acer negundo]|nr:hypothetical protein QYF36_015979 [Acer negundo]